MTATDHDAMPTLLEVPQPADPADVAESYGVGFATGYNQAIVESRAAMERYTLSVAREELQGFKKRKEYRQYATGKLHQDGTVYNSDDIQLAVSEKVVNARIADLDARLSDKNKETA